MQSFLFANRTSPAYYMKINTNTLPASNYKS